MTTNEEGLKVIQPWKKRTYFRSPTFSDITIRYGSNGQRVLPGHRAVICEGSEWFRKACEGDFKEATSRELILEGDDPAALEKMLEYCYTEDYTHFELPLAYTMHHSFIIDQHLAVLIVADKYTALALKELVESRVSSMTGLDGSFAIVALIIECLYRINHTAFTKLKGVLLNLVVEILKGNNCLYEFEVEELIPLIDKYPMFGADLCKRACVAGLFLSSSTQEEV